MIHEGNMNARLWVSNKKKLIKVSFVPINIKLQKCKCTRMMKIHYVTPKIVSFQVQQSMKTSYEAMIELNIDV